MESIRLYDADVDVPLAPAGWVLLVTLATGVGCQVPEEAGTGEAGKSTEMSAEVEEALVPVPPPGPPRVQEPEEGLRANLFRPDRGPGGIPFRWRAPADLTSSPWPEGHPMAERGGGPRPAPLPPRDREGRPLFRIDSVTVGDEVREIRSDLYDSPPPFPAPFHTYLPEGFVVDEIGSASGNAVRFVDGRAPGTQGPPAISAFLFREAVPPDSAEAVAEDIADSRARLEAEEGPPVDWARRTFSFESHTQEGWVAMADLEGRPLIWMFQTPAARRTEFQAKVDLILSGWRWADGDRPFSEPFR